MKGARYVEFGLRDEDDEGRQGNAQLVNCSCFIAELWPEILGCRKGDAISVVGRLRQDRGTSEDGPQAYGVGLAVRHVLSVHKLPLARWRGKEQN